MVREARIRVGSNDRIGDGYEAPARPDKKGAGTTKGTERSFRDPALGRYFSPRQSAPQKRP